MSTDTNTRASSHIITAFFDTAGAAKQAREDLVAAGIPDRHITQSGGHAEGAAAASTGDHRGFWDSLKDFFLPDDDRYTYAEGLRRGGFLLKVDTDEANYTRVQDILDTDGAVDIDDRAETWRSEGWNGYTDPSQPASATDRPATGIATGALLSAGANAPVIPTEARAAYDDRWRADQTVQGGELDRSVDATAAAAATAKRDGTLDRSRLRGYFRDVDGLDPELSNPTAGTGIAGAAHIKEHMEVISADGQKIGLVDHLDGPDRIKLTKNDSPDGQHHIVPFTWIDHVGQRVHLKKTLAEIRAQQTA